MGPSRSLERVSQELAKSVPLLKRWSSRWNWVLSAKAFDAYRDEIASKLALERYIAEVNARLERWRRRDEEATECIYTVFLDTYNDIVQMVRDVKDGKRKMSIKDKAMLIRSFALLAPLQREARDEVARRSALAPGMPHATSAAPVSGAAKAARKAFVETQAKESKP
jgi:hypothetical protein